MAITPATKPRSPNLRKTIRSFSATPRRTEQTTRQAIRTVPCTISRASAAANATSSASWLRRSAPWNPLSALPTAWSFCVPWSKRSLAPQRPPLDEPGPGNLFCRGAALLRPALLGANMATASTEIRVTPEIAAEHAVTPEEYARIHQILGRNPSNTELGIVSVMWSEHCSYKSSKVHLKRLPTRGKLAVQGPGET